MKRLIAGFFIGTLALLSACGGGDKPPVTPPVAPPPSPLTTPVGSSVGTPVTQTISAAGGTLTSGGITLEVLAGTLTSAAITLQPITDTLNGTGQGMAISSDSAWSKYAKISFPIDPSDDDPEGLGLAVQQADGSWLSLEPVKVDVAAGTVTAALSATARASNLAAASVRPLAALKLTSVVKFKRFYLKPSSATVKVKGTKSFTPYAQVIQNQKKDPNCGVTAPTDDNLVPLCQLRQVTREYPFNNDKTDFARSWSVNGILGGNSSIGLISKSGSSGAVYTAPDNKPSPDTVTVSFQSIQTDTLDSVTVRAGVKIIDDVIQTYAGSLNFDSTFAGITTTGQGNITWNLIENLPNDLNKYEAVGSLQVTATYPNCTPVTASVPVTGTMIVFDPVRGGAGDLFATKYWFALLSKGSITATAQCGQPPKATPVAVAFQALTACPENPTLPDASKYSDLSKLTNSGTWACSFISTTANWDLEGK